MQRLAKRRNREDPYAFVGRDTELNFMLPNAANLPPEGGPGGTVVIVGAPGAGKTALLREAARQLAEGRPATAIMPLEPIRSANPDEKRYFFQQLANKLANCDDPADPERTTTKQTHAQGSIPGVVRSGVKHQTTTANLPNVSSFNQVRHLVEGAANGKPKFKPFKRVVLTVDEVQNIKPDSWAAEVLRQAHIQEELPVTVICAGLADSLLALDDAGISRPADEHVLRIGCLPQAKVEQSVKSAVTALASYGLTIDPNVLQDCANRMAEACYGWPAHLHTHMRQMFRHMSGMPDISLTGMDLDAVMRSADQQRQEHYGLRVKTSETPPPVLHAAVSAIGHNRPASKYTVMQAIQDSTESLRKNGNALIADIWDETFDGSAAKCYRQMLHAGIITEDPFECCEVPIPTLATFIAHSANPPNGSIGNRETNLPNR